MPRFSQLPTVDVGYRSTLQLKQMDATLKFNATDGCVELNFASGQRPELKKDPSASPKSSGGEYDLVIALSSIENVRPKEYTDGAKVQLVLIVEQDSFQTTLEFRGGRQDVDAWHKGILSMLHKGDDDAANTATPVPSRKFLPITKVELREPDAGDLIKIWVELGGKDQANLAIPEQDIYEFKNTPEEISLAATSGKKLRKPRTLQEVNDFVNTFVTVNSILPTESTSLYRFALAATQRALVEKETSKIIEEINGQNLDELQRLDDETGPSGGTKTRETLSSEAIGKLDKIAESIPSRIGDKGPGAVVVTQILRQNIEKMKLLNEMTLKAGK